MKTWQEIKAGDTIYYIDHCEVHAQTVHSVEIIEKQQSYNTYLDPSVKTFNKNIVIKAGKSCIKILFRWYSDKTSVRWNGMPRFSCKEAVINYINDDWIC